MAKTQSYKLRSTGPASDTTPSFKTTGLDLDLPTPPSPANTSVSSMSTTSTASPKSVVAHRKRSSSKVKVKSKKYSLPDNISSSAPLPKLFCIRTKSPNVTLSFVSQGIYWI